MADDLVLVSDMVQLLPCVVRSHTLHLKPNLSILVIACMNYFLGGNMYIAVAHNASTNHYISMTSQQQITTSQQTAAMSHFSAAMSQKSAVMSHFCLRCCCDVAKICCDVIVFCCDVTKICCDVAKICCDVLSICCDITASGCDIAANLLFVGATSQQKIKTMQFLFRK